METTDIDISKLRAFDVETPKVDSGPLASRIVVGSTAELVGDKINGAILYPKQLAVAKAREYLEQRLTLVGANIPYDLACLAAEEEALLREVFLALREQRVIDIQLVQALDAIYGGHLGADPRVIKVNKKTGEKEPGSLKNPSTNKITTRYALATVLHLLTGRTDAKDAASWRTSYPLLEGFPLESWPQDPKDYPVDDTRNTLVSSIVQVQGWRRGQFEPGVEGPARNFSNQAFQVRAAFALHLGAAWGFHVSEEKVEALQAEVDEKYKDVFERFKQFGWINDDGSENRAAIKKSIVIAYGGDPNSKCSKCQGSGKVRKLVISECRGPKLGGRFKGCPGDGCPACAGTKQIGKLGNEVICLFKEGGCDGTGLDAQAVEAKLKKSDGDGISADRDVKMESGNDDLSDFGDNETNKIRTTYLPYLRRGIGRPLILRPNPLLYTGRVSYDDPIQQFPRKGKCRACIVARKGYCFCSTDYAAGELCTLGQMCIWTTGHSEMVRIINETKDPGSLHAMLASRMMGKTFEEVRALLKALDKRAKDFRQASKAGNFGFGGAMGSATFVLQKRKLAEGFTMHPEGPSEDHDKNRGYNGIRFCILLLGADRCGEQKITEWNKRKYAPVCKKCVEAVEGLLKPAFFSLYPEVKKYHEWVKKMLDKHGLVPSLAWNKEKQKFEILRWRGGCNLTAGANNGFQSLLSDIGKLAYVRATEECYLGEMYDGSGYSPLAGSRLPAFMHDEPLAEMPLQTAHLAGPRMGEIMVQSGYDLAPDVFWKAEPALSEYWDKDAETVLDKDGNLTLWKPKEKERLAA